MSVILDSSYIIAYSDERDKYHKEAIGLSKHLSSGDFGQIFISDYIFDEVVTYFLARQGIEKAISVGEYLLKFEIELLHSTSELFSSSWIFFKQRKNLSFTDCITIEIMKAYGIRNIATFDAGFNQFEKEMKILR